MRLRGSCPWLGSCVTTAGGNPVGCERVRELMIGHQLPPRSASRQNPKRQAESNVEGCDVDDGA